MKIAAHTSLAFWNALPAPQRARTLALDRFASFPVREQNGRYAKDPANKEYRRETCDAVAGGSVLRDGSSAWLQFLREGLCLPDSQMIFGQLQSRLMVNMAGGVLENGGLCLDRRTGQPFIPGSAVKGCARRAALAALHEWCETGVKPAGDDNLFTAACAQFHSPPEMLAAIARVFGWSEQEWSEKKKDGHFVSDFAWACGDKHEEIWKETAEQFASQLHVAIRGEHKETPWKSLPNFAGSISFLPAYPVDLGKTGKVNGLPVEIPLLGKLELDIVTCHHGEYYASDAPDKKATDTEEPVPVVFPAVAAGHVFAFAVLPLRNCADNQLTHARDWMATGLQTFGLGAKTAAGYGWFDASYNTHKTIVDSLEKSKRERELATAKAKQEAAEKAKQEEAARRKRELAEKLAKLTPEEQEDAKVEALTDDQFRSALDNYAKRAAEEQKAIVRTLRLEPNGPGNRRAFWDDLKDKAQKKGGKYAQTEQAIRQLSKQMFPGKEGKMP